MGREDLTIEVDQSGWWQNSVPESRDEGSEMRSPRKEKLPTLQLYNKLDHLDKLWQSQKTQKRGKSFFEVNTQDTAVKNGREAPEPSLVTMDSYFTAETNLVATFSADTNPEYEKSPMNPSRQPEVTWKSRRNLFSCLSNEIYESTDSTMKTSHDQIKHSAECISDADVAFATEKKTLRIGQGERLWQSPSSRKRSLNAFFHGSSSSNSNSNNSNIIEEVKIDSLISDSANSSFETSERDLPPEEANFTPNDGADATIDFDSQPISQSGSFGSTVSKKQLITRCESFATYTSTTSKEKHSVTRSESFTTFTTAMSKDSDFSAARKQQLGPRSVTMFDRLYQKSKLKRRTARNTKKTQSIVSVNRSQRRQRSAKEIQRIFRGSRVRRVVQKNVAAAVQIQFWWSSVLCRVSFLALRKAVIMAQSLERRRLAILVAKQRRNSVLAIQSLWWMRCAKSQLLELAREKQQRVRQDRAAMLIQHQFLKHILRLRQDRDEGNYMLVSAFAFSSDSQALPSDEYQQHQFNLLEKNSESRATEKGKRQNDLKVRTSNQFLRNSSTAPDTEASPRGESTSASLYRAAKLRRRAMKHSSQQQTPKHLVSLKNSASKMVFEKGELPSVALEYLPANKRYYNSNKLSALPILQRWAREQLERKKKLHAVVKLQSAWRLFSTLTSVISTWLLEEWCVRVDFHEDEKIKNPVLRQQVRLMALTNAIQKVNKGFLPVKVYLSSYGFAVDWKNEVTIKIWSTARRVEEFFRCSVHVICGAQRHTLWDAWSSQKKFTTLSKAALIKSFYNQRLRMNQVKSTQQNSAALKIQMFWLRCTQAFPEIGYLQQARIAAVQIQSCYRTRLCTQTLKKRIISASIIQAVVVGYFVRRKIRVLSISSTKIQSIFRGFATRNKMEEAHLSATKIQAVYQCYMASIKLAKMRYAAIQIQSIWRMALCIDHLLLLDIQACTIQSVVRGYFIRSYMKKARQAATMIQAVYKCYSVRLKFMKMCQAAIKIQSNWRMALCIDHLLLLDIHVCTIQSVVRGFFIRCYMKKANQSATKIGAVYRGHTARVRFMKTCQAAIQLQSVWRMSQCIDHLIFLDIQACTIQSVVRGFFIRSHQKKTEVSATRIQAAYRGCIAVVKFEKIKEAAVKIQSVWRMSQCIDHLVFVDIQACTIQSVSRGFIARQQLRYTKLSAIFIQKKVRAILAQQKLNIMLRAVTLLQSWCRMLMCHGEFGLQKAAAIAIQSSFRRYLRRKRHQNCQSLAITIDALWRRYSTRKRLEKLHKSASLIQSSMKKVICRRKSKIRIQSVYALQARARVFLAKRRFETTRRAAVQLQTWYRMAVLMQIYEIQVMSALIIQRIYRGYVARKSYKMCAKQIGVVQALPRKRQAHKCVSEHMAADQIIQSWRHCQQKKISALAKSLERQKVQNQAASSIQSFYIRRIAKTAEMRYLEQARSAAVRIQAWFRMTLCLQLLDILDLSACFLQSVVRSYLARKRAKLQILEKKMAAVRIQACWRSFFIEQMAANKIQAFYRSHFLRENPQAYKIHHNMPSEAAECRRQDTFNTEASEYQLCSILTFPADKTELSAVMLQTSYRAYKCQQGYFAQKMAVTTIQKFWRKYVGMHRFFTRALVSDDAIEAFLEDRPCQIAWLKRVRTIAATIVQRFWRSKRGPLSTCTKPCTLSHENLASTPHVPLSLSQNKQEKGLSSSEELTREMGFSATPFLLFDPQRLFELSSFRSYLSPVQQAADEGKNRFRSAALIQRWWRNSIRKRDECKLNHKSSSTDVLSNQYSVSRSRAFSELRRIIHAASLLEAVARGFLTRRRLQKDEAVRILQCQYRAMVARAKYLRTIKGAVACQKLWHRYSSTSGYRSQVARRNRGIVMSQRLLKRRFQEKSLAAVRLQRHWRTYMSSKKMGDAAIIIQQNWKMSNARHRFQKSKYCVICLQSHWRRRSCQLKYEKLRSRLKTEAALRIQTQWRMWVTSDDYHIARHGILAIQKIARTLLVAKTRAVICLQKISRSYCCQQRYQKIRQQSIKIQAAVRAFGCRVVYTKFRQYLTVLQRKARLDFLRKTTSVLLIQRNYRTRSAITNYLCARSAAICLQTKWRTSLKEADYGKMKKGFTALRACGRNRFAVKMNLSVCIQSLARMRFASEKFQKMRLGATILESVWRRYLCRKNFKKQTNGFSSLQQTWRKQFRVKSTNAIVIESYWRRAMAKRDLERAQHASIMLAAHIRKHLCRSSYEALRQGFIALQGLAKLWFRIKTTCAVRIQSATRQWLARKHYLSKRKAVIKTQSVFRGYLQRRNLAVFIWLREIAATMIASWWRRIVAESNYQNLLGFTRFLQYSFRLRRGEKAVVCLQNRWRGSQARSEYRNVQRRIVLIQIIVRFFLRKRRIMHGATSRIQCLFTQRVHAACVIQRWWRIANHGKKLAGYVDSKMTDDSLKLSQSQQNVFCNTQEFSLSRTSYGISWMSSPILSIGEERMLSSWLSSPDASNAEERARPHVAPSGVTSMSSRGSGGLDEVALSSQSQVSTTASHPYQAKGCYNPISILCNFDDIEVLAGSFWSSTKTAYSEDDTKNMKQLDDLRKSLAATRIQRRWKSLRYRQTKDYFFRSVAAAWIQCLWRGFAARKKIKENKIARINRAALIIKKAWRDFRLKIAALKIQKAWRSHHCRRVFVQAVRVQSFWRCRHTHQEFLRIKVAAITLQKAFREKRSLRKEAAEAENNKNQNSSWWLLPSVNLRLEF